MALVTLHGRDPGANWSATQLARFCQSGSSPDRAGAEHLGLVAIGGKAYLGSILLTRVLDEAEIIDVVVDPAARRQGTGRQLLRAALALLRGRGVTRCHLEVRASNRAARALYGEQGFIQTGRRAAYYRSANGTAEDALMMSRSLSGEI